MISSMLILAAALASPTGAVELAEDSQAHEAAPNDQVLALEPGEAELVKILDDLASQDHRVILRGIAAAQESRNRLFEGPLRRMLRVARQVEVEVAAATALAELDWPVDSAGLQARVQALARASFEGESVVRTAATMALGSFPTPEAQRLLSLKMEGVEGEEREAVGRALQRMRTPEVLARLGAWLSRQAGGPRHGVPHSWRTALDGRALLTDPTAEGMDGTVRALTGAADPQLVRGLIAFAARNGDASSKLVALRHMQQKPLPIDVPHLAGLLADPSQAVRLAAIHGLAQHRGEEATNALAAHLTAEPFPSLQEAVAQALHSQETRFLAPALAAALSDATGYALEVAGLLVRDMHGTVAIWPKTLALAATQDDVGREALLAEPVEERRRELLPRLRSDLSAEVRVAVLVGMTGVEDAEAVRAVLNEIRAAAAPEVLRAAGEALAAQADERVVPRLEKALVGADIAGRETLLDLLAARTSPEAVRATASAITREPDDNLAAGLIARVAGRTEPELVAAIAGRLAVTQPPRIHAAALSALRSVDDPTLAKPYLDLVRHAPAGGTVNADVGSGAADLAALDRYYEALRLAGPGDGRTAIALMAYGRLTSLPEPTATNALRDLAADRELLTGLRLRAIHDLGARRSPENLAALELMLDEDDAQIRGAARNAMHAIAPELYPAWDQYGRYPLVAAAGVAGTALLLLSTRIAELMTDTNPNDTLVGGAGAALGLSSAWLLTLDTDVSLGGAGYFATLGAWGALGGYGLGRVADFGNGEATGPLWAALGGEAIGVATGALTVGLARFSGGHVLATNAIAASWGAGAVSLAYLTRSESGNASAADVFALGGALSIAPMAVVASRLQLDESAVLGVLTTAGLVSWAGAFAPYAVVAADSRRDLDFLAGIGLGQAVGAAGGLLLSQVTTFDRETAGWATVGAVSGASLGAGLGLSHAAFSGRPKFAMLEVGTLAGAGTLAWLGPELEFRGTDIALIAMMTAGGAVTGARFPEKVAQAGDVPGVDEDAPESSLWGGALMGASLGFYTGLATSQLVDLSPGEVTMAGVGAAVLGTGAAGAVLLYPELGADNFSPAFAAGAAIGVVGLGAHLAPKLRYEPADISLGVSTGALGAFLGSWMPAYDTPEGRPLPDARQWGGGMLGGAFGLLFAGVVSQFQDVDPGRVLRVDVGALGGMAIGAGLGLVTPESSTPDYDRKLTVGLMHAGAVTGFTVASIVERRRLYTWADRLHVGLGGVMGAWHGSLIPYLWRAEPADGSESVPDAEVWGGLLVGAGAGYFATRTALRFAQKDSGDLAEVVLMDGLGTALGAGIWTLSSADRRLRFGVLEGAGLAAWLAGELFAGQTVYSWGDSVLIASMTAAGGVGGLGLPYLLYDHAPTTEEIAGGGALGAGALGLAALGLSQLTEYDEGEVAAALSIGALGASIGWGIGRARLGVGHESRLALGDLGLFAGLGVGLAAAPWLKLTGDDFGWMVLTTGLGGWLGSLAPVQRYGGRAGNEQRWGGALAGASIGALGMAAVGQLVEWDLETGIEGASVSVASSLIAGGLGLTEIPRRPKQEALSLQLASLGGFVAGSLVAPYTDIGADGVKTMGTMALVGAWQGTWAPQAFGNDDQHQGGGAMAGAGAGWLAGYALSQVLELGFAQDAETLAGCGIGTMVGIGLGAMLGWSDSRTAGALEIGSMAGSAGGLVASYVTRYEPDDMVFILSAGAWGAWHGFWLGDAAARGEAAAERRRSGGAFFGLGVGLGAGMAASQLVDVRGGDIAEATLAMASANAVGVGAAKLLELDDGMQTAMLEAGGLAGATLGLLFAEQTEFRDNDGILVGMTSVLGASHGAMLNDVFRAGEQQEDAVWGGTLLGAGIGTAGGMVLAQYVDLDGYDLLEIGVATATGDAIGFGLGHWLGLDRQAHLALVEVGGLGVTGLALWLAETTEYQRNDRLLLAYGVGWGGWLGGWAPQMWLHQEDGGQNAAGVLLGASVGALVAAGASQALDMPVRDVGETAYGTLTTSLVGAGVGLLLQPDGELWVTMMEATSVVGTLAVGWAAPRTDYSTGDAVLGTLAALYGLYNGAGLSYLANADDRQVAGAMMAAGAAGALTASYLGPYLQLDGTDILMLLAGSAWGVWTGIWTAAAIDEAQRDVIDREVFFLGVGTTAVATDLAVLLTSIAISKLVEMPPQRFAWISVGGGVGLVSGLLATALLGKSPKSGIAIGSVAGLVGGTVATSFLDWAPSRAEPKRVAYDSGGDGSASALLPQIESWFPSVGAVPVGAADPLAPSPGAQLMVTVSGTYR